MGLTAKNEGGDFATVPAGAKVARCYRLVDLGTQYNEMYNASKHQVLISWEFPDELMDDGKPFALSGFYTVSLHEKANLRKILESWRGRVFTEEEMAGFDLKNILNQPCYLQVLHDVNSQGKTKAKIASVLPLPKGMACPEAVNPLVVFNLDEFDEEVFNTLPEGIQKMINNSLERQPVGVPSDDLDDSGAIDNDDIPF